MTRIPFYTGDGSGPVTVDVQYLAKFPIGPDGSCAFCHGDPTAESSPPSSPIYQYFERNKTWAFTCPMCDGQAE